MKSPIILTALCVSSSVFATGFSQPLTETSLKWQFRYRLEQVNPDNALDTALASTLRSRATLQTGQWQLADSHQFSALVEVDNVSALGGDTYNSTVNGHSKYAVIPDPTGTELNQAALLYKAGAHSTLTLGRQRINLGNQRFVGSVGWRQNEQTFDGLRLQQQFSATLQLDVATLHNSNRVFGPDGPAADLHGRFNLGQLNWTVLPEQQLQAFHYDFDFDSLASRSSTSSGLDYSGTAAAGSAVKGLKWQLALARQQDAHAAPQAYDVNYHRLELSYQLSGVTGLSIKAWQERLGSDGKTAFQTPFATLHAFNGFADMFLTTPAQGLREHAVQLNMPVAGVKTSLSLHRFTSDFGNSDYGNELDLTLGYDLSDKWQLLAKAAVFNTEQYQVDTHKFWLMLSFQP